MTRSTRPFLPACMFVALLAATGDASARFHRINVALAPDSAGTPREGVITFRSAIQHDGAPSTVSAALTGSTGVQLEAGTYRVEVAAAGWWMAPRIVTVRADDTLTLLLRPTVTVHGQAVDTIGAPLPQIVVRFEARNDSAISGDARCRVVGTSFFCEVPQGRLDLRVGANGYVPHYRWDVSADPLHEVNLGSFRLVPGASLSGRVQSEAGATQGVQLSLSSVRSGGHAATLRTLPDIGFFLAGPIPPGEYTITATQKGLISPALTVTVVEGAEARLRDPIVLSKPRALVISVSPPADPLGGTWRMRLVRSGNDSRSSTDVTPDSPASADGTWRADNLTPGKYELLVRPHGGRVWHVEEVTIDDVLTWRRVTMKAVQFRGTVRLGDQPIPARVIFGGEYSASPLPFDADERGEFRGFLPASDTGLWRVTVKSDQPRITSTLTNVEVETDSATGVASVDIRLPETGITGEVVTRDGRPAPNAIVTIFSGLDGDSRAQFVADSDGRFDVHGIAPGQYRVSAGAYLAEAPITTIEVPQDATEPVFVRLEMGALRKWEGSITTPDGRPVAGARIMAVPVDVQTEFSLHDESNGDGRFTVLVPSAARLADIRVAADGFTFSTSRRPVTNAPLEVVIDPRGATLVVDYDSVPGYEPFLWHNGAPSSVEGLMVEWRGQIESTASGRRRLRIPNLEYGGYTLCLLQGRAFDYAMSTPPPGPSCTTIYVPPFGVQEVRLTASKLATKP